MSETGKEKKETPETPPVKLTVDDVEIKGWTVGDVSDYITALNVGSLALELEKTAKAFAGHDADVVFDALRGMTPVEFKVIREAVRAAVVDYFRS